MISGLDFRVICDPLSVETSVNKSGVLTCHTRPAHDLSSETVKWKIAHRLGDKSVHVFTNGKDDPNEQDDHFKGRTELHKEGLKEGNITLEIFKISSEDEGTYNCTVSIYDEKDELHSQIGTVKLSVTAKGERDAPPTTDSTGIIIGVVIPLVVVVAILGVVLFVLHKKNKLLCTARERHNRQPVSQNESDNL